MHVRYHFIYSYIMQITIMCGLVYFPQVCMPHCWISQFLIVFESEFKHNY